ncbi:MFS transporter [Bradyrhizobium sp. WSM 1704]|uniref:MFS transporter n=1 Tax=Bradyrhizobium semiaridum TaxID=2821404 RepID=UPI001CE26780|nr:MFS transporter [Bradyrhizobium semiaridum]MCA6124404.1 MFS transporter [Bradyrhizobium semiaridum]
MAQLGIAHARRSELQGSAALASVATLIGTAFGLSTLVTPLYLLYQQQFGFSQITLTLIYAAYVLGNIAALLFVGRISDGIGRRVTALVATLVLFAAALVFLFANGIAALYVARILSGLGIGIASGSANAWLAELVGKGDTARAATIGTSSNFLGLGIAALASGLLAQYAPWPLHLSFVAYLVVLCAVALLVWFCHETVRHPDTSRLTVRPKLAVPHSVRAQFVAPAITGFGLMALVGFYAALMPAILSQDLHVHNHAAGGALLFELAIVVAFVIVATQAVDSRVAMLWSLALMIPAAAAMVAAQAAASLRVMLAATAGVGVSAGLGYRGSLQVVNQIAPAEQRASVVSSYFVCCFIGNAVPVIGVGVLSSFTRSVIADLTFACVIAAFALAALMFGLAHRQ